MSEEDKTTFSTSIGLILSLLGCVVGTGNIWRFPRIIALTSDNSGSLSFLIAWLIFLLLWSMPMILAEYALGRYAKGGPIAAFRSFIGRRSGWSGMWVVGATLLIGCYYIVIEGWCFYYIYYSITVNELPTTGPQALTVFNDFSTSRWPILTQGIGLLLAAACTIGGIRWIEKTNMVLMPLLLLILVFTFCWSLSLDYSDYGIKTMFNPNWEKMKDPNLWINAATQNAFDTSAAMGLFLTYASYMSPRNSVVKLSIFIPLGNNIVSLLCGITIFSTAFSVLTQDPSMTRAGIMDIMKTNGPGGTGLTFVWMPVLFGTAGLLGRIICVLFFICLSFAGFSSVLSFFELGTVALLEMGVPNRKVATCILTIFMFGIGFGSAWSIDVLTNQDAVWGFAILLSGLCIQFAICYYGVFKFRKVVVNSYGYKDWNLPIIWCIMIQIVAPLEALGLLGWWIYDMVTKNPNTWYKFTLDSLVTVLVEWAGLLVIAVILNFILLKVVNSWKFVDMNAEDMTTSRNAQASFTRTNDMYMCWDNSAYDGAVADGANTDSIYDVPEYSRSPRLYVRNGGHDNSAYMYDAPPTESYRKRKGSDGLTTL